MSILFIAYEQGEIDKDFMQDINYYRDLVRVLAKLVGDNYDLQGKVMKYKLTSDGMMEP